MTGQGGHLRNQNQTLAQQRQRGEGPVSRGGDAGNAGAAAFAGAQRPERAGAPAPDSNRTGRDAADRPAAGECGRANATITVTNHRLPNRGLLEIDAAVLSQIYTLVGWKFMAQLCGEEQPGASMYISPDHRKDLQRLLMIAQLGEDTTHFFSTELDAAEAVCDG